MKLTSKILTFLVLLSTLFSCKSDSEKLLLSEGFVAFIVKDFDTSADWYINNLGFELLNKTNLEERGIKQGNLKLGHAKIELIESTTSIDPTDNNTKKGLVQGIFKIGFIISNFDDWKTHLINKQLITENDIVVNPLDNKRMLILKDPDGNRIQLFEK